jgi:hypothetical protein
LNWSFILTDMIHWTGKSSWQVLVAERCLCLCFQRRNACGQTSSAASQMTSNETQESLSGIKIRSSNLLNSASSCFDGVLGQCFGVFWCCCCCTAHSRLMSNALLRGIETIAELFDYNRVLNPKYLAFL